MTIVEVTAEERALLASIQSVHRNELSVGVNFPAYLDAQDAVALQGAPPSNASVRREAFLHSSLCFLESCRANINQAAEDRGISGSVSSWVWVSVTDASVSPPLDPQNRLEIAISESTVIMQHRLLR